MSEATLAPADDGWEAVMVVPFELTEDATVYAKIIPTPKNAVNDGSQANGTVTNDHARGLSGWWVQFRFLDEEGMPVAPADAPGPNGSLGAYVTSEPTPRIALPAGTHALEVTVHAPDGGVNAGQMATVYTALAVSGSEQTGTWGASGATQDEAQALEHQITQPAGDPPRRGGGSGSGQPPAGDTGSPGDGGTGGDGSGEAPGDEDETPPSSDPGQAPSPTDPVPEGEGDGAGAPAEGETQASISIDEDVLLWLLVVLGLLLLILLFLVTVLVIAALALVFVLWREYLEGQPAGPTGPAGGVPAHGTGETAEPAHPPQATSGQQEPGNTGDYPPYH